MVEYDDTSHPLCDTLHGPCGSLRCRECLFLCLSECVSRRINQTAALDLTDDVQKDQHDNVKAGELQVFKHLKECLENPMSCPYSEVGCLGKSLPFERIAEHFQKEIYIHNETLVEYIMNKSQDHLDSTNEDVDKPIRKELEGFCRNILDVLSKKQVLILGLLDEISDLKWKVEEFGKLTSSLRSTNEENMKLVGDLKVNHELKMHELRQYFDTELKKFQHDMSKHRESVRHKETELKTMRQKISKVEKLFTRFNSKNKCVREKIIKVADFRWSIEDIKELRNDGEEMIYSEYFYSVNKDYKMRLWLYPNGIGDVIGDDISVQLLLWNNGSQTVFPVKADVTVSMKNILKPQICQTITQLCLFDKPGIFIYSISEPFNFNYWHLKLAGVFMDDLTAVECIVFIYK